MRERGIVDESERTAAGMSQSLNGAGRVRIGGDLLLEFQRNSIVIAELSATSMWVRTSAEMPRISSRPSRSTKALTSRMDFSAQ
jgi:hypothetical protein